MIYQKTYQDATKINLFSDTAKFRPSRNAITESAMLESVGEI